MKNNLSKYDKLGSELANAGLVYKKLTDPKTKYYLREEMPPMHYEEVVPIKAEKQTNIAMALPHSVSPKVNTSANENNEAHLDKIKPATDLSSWVAKNDYYLKRHEDYMKRYPWKTESPYYLDFGDRYLKRFNNIKSKFSPEGQKWIEQTALQLKQYMEAGLKEDLKQNNVKNYKEFDNEAFLDFAYSTHAEAYMKGGMYELLFENFNYKDIMLLISILKAKDTLFDPSLRGQPEMYKVLRQCAERYINSKLQPTNQVVHNEMMKLVNEILKYKGAKL